MSFPNPLRAVVTGAGGGLGRALALELADRGASLFLSDIREESLAETLQLAHARGAPAHAVLCDVRDRNAVFELVERCTSELGGIDLLANNAGVAVGGPFEETSIEDWQWCIDINLWGVIYGCQAAVPHMKRQGSGYIINVASAAGLLAPPGMAAYNVAKAGVVALSETLYAELKPNGVNVAVLCPTFFQTEIADSARGPMSDRQARDLRRWMQRSKVQADDVANAAVDAVRDGKLYVQPMRDGRSAWRLKRLHPQRYYNLLSRVAASR